MLSIPLRAVALALLIHTLWGGNPVAVKLSIEAFPPMWTAFYRFLIGVLCVGAFAVATGVRVWPERGEWPALVAIALLFTVQIGLMNVGFGMTTGAVGAVVIATNPLFGALFSHFLVPDDRLRPLRALGLAVAFVGTATAILAGRAPGGDGVVAGLGLVEAGSMILLVSAALLGLRLAISGRVLRRIHETRVAVWQMLLSLPLFWVAGMLGEPVRWERATAGPVLGLLFQGVVIAGIAFVINFALMRRHPPSIIVSFNFVSPVAGVLLAAWILGESPSAGLLLGMILVAVGLVLVTWRGTRAIGSSPGGPGR
ncbi:MAG: DMT family transporter [Ectothiorhodospiraceae bacterium]|nr:DMT family transporter [Ectothiorhodospiraceae bacterium]